MKSRFEGFEHVQLERLVQEYRHDYYKSGHKMPEPTLCPKCAAVYQEGRWQWMAKPAHAHEEMCPACHRIVDEFPAGFVSISGAFCKKHRAELLDRIRTDEAQARAEHPLKRIIKIEDQDNGIAVTTTDIHLARGIGSALQHAYDGELELHYNRHENQLHVVWER